MVWKKYSTSGARCTRLEPFGVELPSKEALMTLKYFSQYGRANCKEKSSSQSRLNSVFLQDTGGITIRIHSSRGIVVTPTIKSIFVFYSRDTQLSFRMIPANK
jgi:hypothetical protein